MPALLLYYIIILRWDQTIYRYGGLMEINILTEPRKKKLMAEEI